MDSLDEIQRKQQLLRRHAGGTRIRLKYHDSGISWVEGIFSRGDRRLGDALELGWRRGARFDGWEECFDVQRWAQVFEELGIPADAFLGTIPVDARLPWDHIDVGLEDGFLAKEYRMALKDRLSPPCGKPYGDIIHHTNLEDAEADKRKLICYDCGVACDMTAMREERLVMLRTLGAYERSAPKFVAETLSQLPKEQAKAIKKEARKWTAPVPQQRFAVDERHKVRLRYAKLGRFAYLGHLDVARVLARVFRRAGMSVAYSQGFHPKPVMEYGPALSLGIPSLGEVFDVALANDLPASEVLERLRQVSPEGLEFLGAVRVAEGEKRLSKCIAGFELLIAPAPDGIAFDEARCRRLADRALASDSLEVPRKDKIIQVRQYLDGVDVIDAEGSRQLCAALDWEVVPALFRARVLIPPTGSAKPIEVAKALGVAGSDSLTGPHARLARVGFWGLGDAGVTFDPLASGAEMATLAAL